MSILLWDLFLALLTISTGIVFAGIVFSLYHAIADETPRFSMLQSEGWELFCYVILLIFAGPLVIIRNCYYGRILENRPIAHVFGGAVIAATWGLLTGMSVLTIILNYTTWIV